MSGGGGGGGGGGEIKGDNIYYDTAFQSHFNKVHTRNCYSLSHFLIETIF